MLTAFAVLLLALAPFALGWAARRAALRPGASADDVWFAFTQRIQWVGLVNLVAWPSLGGAWTMTALRSVVPGMAAPWPVPLAAAAMMGPVIAFQLCAARWLSEVNRRVRGADAPPANALRGLWVTVGVASGVAGLYVGIAAFGRGDAQTAMVALIAGIAAMLVTMRLAAPPRRLSPHAVTSGELRDRVFALAGRAGVRLGQLYVIPATHSRTANALAVQNQVVMITDYLVQNLTRDQLDAVLAHELAHLRRRHPAWLAATLFGSGVLVWTSVGWWGAGLAPLVSGLAALFAFFALSRRFEYAADAGALELGASPEALISGLARVHALNHVPVRWSRAREWTVTHPSTERRALAIAARAGLDSARALACLEPGADADGVRYALPPGAGTDRVFSSAFKQAALVRNGWLMVLGNVTFTVVMAGVATALGLSGPARAVAFLPLALASFGVTLFLLQRLAMRPYHALRAPLLERLRHQGFDPRGRDTDLVGLAPGDRARYYEGFASWDVGFLWWRGDRLVYLGEEASFSLARDEVTTVEPGERFPGWLRPGGLCVRWSRRDGQSGAFTLHTVRAGGLMGVAAENRRLAERIQEWRDREGPDPPHRRRVAIAPEDVPAPAMPVPIAPPPTGEVTSTEPTDALKSGAVVFTVLVHLALVGVLALAVGLEAAPRRGMGALDAMLAASIAYVLVVAPMVRRGSRRESSERAGRRAA